MENRIKSSWECAMLKKIHRSFSRLIKAFMENYGILGDKHLICYVEGTMVDVDQEEGLK